MKNLKDVTEWVANEVAHFWRTREKQTKRQRESGRKDRGARGAVTGGAQMDGFIGLFTDLILMAGIEEKFIFRKRCLELPGFFRPTKEWDLIAVKNEQLILAIEVKS